MDLRTKALTMIDILVGTFEHMIDNIAVDGLEGVDKELWPEEVKKLHAFIAEKLTEDRDGYENVIVDVISKHLDESDIDAIIEFNRSATGVKLRAINQTIQNEMMLVTGKWRNAALEKHTEEVKRLMGIEAEAKAE